MRVRDDEDGTSPMDECIRQCGECHHLCIRTAHDRLQLVGAHANYIGLLLDCASICRAAEDFMLRPSHLHQNNLPGLRGGLRQVRRRLRENERYRMRRSLPALRAILPRNARVN